MKKIEIFTDGACSGNPGPGGYGVILKYQDKEKEISEGYKLTTNNRMELLAVIIGLETLKEPCDVTIYSDSKYIVDAINQKWVYKWQMNGWMRNKKEKALNSDLWKRLLEVLKKHKTDFKWVKGHAGHKENERCDFLATEAIKNHKLLDDVEFTKMNKEEGTLF